MRGEHPLSRTSALLVAYLVSSLTTFVLLARVDWLPPESKILMGLTAISMLAWCFFWAEIALMGEFPRTEVKWVAIWSLLTAVALESFATNTWTSQLSVALLGLFGAAFMGYVNLRFGTPYVFDFVLPLPYILMFSVASAELTGLPAQETELVGMVAYVSLLIAQYWRTKRLGKLERLKRAIRGRTGVIGSQSSESD